MDCKNLVENFNVPDFLKSVLANLVLTTLIIYFTLFIFNNYLIVDGFLSFILFSMLQVAISILLIYLFGVDSNHKKIINQYLNLKLKKWIERS